MNTVRTLAVVIIMNALRTIACRKPLVMNALRTFTGGIAFAVGTSLTGATDGVVGDTGRTTKHWGLGAAFWQTTRDFNFISGRHGGKKKRGSVPVFFFLSCLVGFMWCACVFVVFVVFYCFVGLWHERRDYFSSISKSS